MSFHNYAICEKISIHMYLAMSDNSPLILNSLANVYTEKIKKEIYDICYYISYCFNVSRLY